MKRLACLWLLIICNLAALSVLSWADAPVEDYYVLPKDVPRQVLVDAQGVLSIRIPGVDPEKQDQPYGKTVRFRTFSCRDSTFSHIGWITLDQTRPLSGWDYPTERVRRFPVVDRKGEYLHIIWDVKEDERTWVNMVEITKLTPPNWPSHSNLDWYEAPGRTKSSVSFFEFSQQAPKIFREPSRSSAWQPLKEVSQGITREAENYRVVGLEIFRPLHQNFVIVEIREGFGRVAAIDPCGDRPDEEIGWILLRDNEGRLAVWPEVGWDC